MLVLLALTFLKIVSDAFSGLATTGWMYYIGKITFTLETLKIKSIPEILKSQHHRRVRLLHAQHPPLHDGWLCASARARPSLRFLQQARMKALKQR